MNKRYRIVLKTLDFGNIKSVWMDKLERDATNDFMTEKFHNLDTLTFNTDSGTIHIPRTVLDRSIILLQEEEMDEDE